LESLLHVLIRGGLVPKGHHDAAVVDANGIAIADHILSRNFGEGVYQGLVHALGDQIQQVCHIQIANCHIYTGVQKGGIDELKESQE